MKILKTVKPEVAEKLCDLGFAYTTEYLRIENEPRKVWCFSVEDEVVDTPGSLLFSEGDFFVSDTLCF